MLEKSEYHVVQKKNGWRRASSGTSKPDNDENVQEKEVVEEGRTRTLGLSGLVQIGLYLRLEPHGFVVLLVSDVLLED